MLVKFSKYYWDSGGGGIRTSVREELEKLYGHGCFEVEVKKEGAWSYGYYKGRSVGAIDTVIGYLEPAKPLDIVKWRVCIADR